MSRLPFEAFLALRYLRPRRTFVSVITLISIIGVTLGVAVLIVVISVMSGFDKEYRELVLGFNSHMKVFRADHNTGLEIPLNDFTFVINQINSNKNVTGVAPFVRGQVLVKTQPSEGNPKVSAPILRGIDPFSEGKVSVLPNSITQGEFSVEGNSLLIGREFAKAMKIFLNDRVAIYSPGSLERMERTRNQTNAEAVLPDEYVVRGIFDVGFAEYNASVIVTSLEKAQELYDFPDDSVHGLQVMLHDPFQADVVRKELKQTLGPDFDIVTWHEESPELFNALAVEKNMMFFLLFFIMIVAAFGIINSQITFVVQKTREIGILKALGANNRQLMWLFLSQSVVVGVAGVSLGFGLALLALKYRNEFLAFMNNVTGFELLPSSIYNVYSLPASIQASDILIICGTAFVSCVLAGVFPAWKASRLQPVEALRYE